MGVGGEWMLNAATGTGSAKWLMLATTTHCHQLPATALATPDCHVPRNRTATLPPQHRTPTQLTQQSATASRSITTARPAVLEKQG